MSLVNKIKFFNQISLSKYIYYNYFCSNVNRKGNGRIIPYKGAVVDITKNAVINLFDGDLEIGCNKLKKSKAETYLRLRSNAVWNVFKSCCISYGSTIELLNAATINSKYFTVNSNSVIVISKQLTIENDVMIGRNVTVYDSDFHSINNNTSDNYSSPIYIGNHVWIASNCTVLKGVKLHDGCVIAANSILLNDVYEKQLVGNNIEQKVIKENIEWKR